MRIQPSSSLAPRHDRVYELDLLRFLAAFSVLVFHYAFRGAARDNLTDFHYTAISGFSRYGYLGVELFFMISGFVIIMSAAGATPRQFVISRLVRLYPAFWVCCSITFLMSVLIGGARFSIPAGRYLTNLTMLNGFLGVPGVDGAYWTLAVEIRFYLLIFLLLWFRQFHRLQLFLWFWLVMAAIIPFYPVRYVGFFLMPEYAGYFIAGAAFYLVYLYGWTGRQLALVAGGCALALREAVLDAGVQSASYNRSFSLPVVVGCVTAFIGVFALIASRKLWARGSANFLALGAVTYPLYLLHQFAGYMIFNELVGRVNPHLLFWGVAALMIGTAYAVNVLIERRSAKRLRRFLDGLLPGDARNVIREKPGLETP